MQTATALMVAAATAIAVAVGVAVPLSVKYNKDIESDFEGLAIFSRIRAAIPSNDLPLPVPGASLADDGCGNAAVQFSDGHCHPVLEQGPCQPFHWVTFDPLNFKVRHRFCNFSNTKN